MSWLSEALNWTDRHSGAVQAVGTIVVAGVGFFSIWWQRRREEKAAMRSQRAIAETLAIRIYPYMVEYAEQARRAAGNETRGGFALPTAVSAIENQLYVFRDFAPHMIVVSAERYPTARRAQSVDTDPAMSGGRKAPERAQIIFGPLADAAEAARDELQALVESAAKDRSRARSRVLR